MAEHDSLETKYQNIDSLKEHYRIELGLAIRNYPIHFTKEFIHDTQLMTGAAHQ